jgi:hypothetical protein
VKLKHSKEEAASMKMAMQEVCVLHAYKKLVLFHLPQKVML